MKVIRSIAVFFIIGLFMTAEILPGVSQNISRENQIIPVSKGERPFAPMEQKSNLINAQNLVQQGRESY